MAVLFFRYLRYLNLSYNKIECIEKLNHLTIQSLHLEHNNIFEFEEGVNVGFQTLNRLTFVDLSYNQLSSLRLFRGATCLQDLCMFTNKVECVMELNYLRGLRHLTRVDLRDNPITSKPHYYKVCLDCMKYITVLDQNVVHPAEKVKLLVFNV